MSQITTQVQETAADGPSRLRRFGRRLRRWARNAILALLTLSTLAVVAGQFQKARLARAYPAPGELVDVGGHRLHVMRSGNGPTVVFENGPGGLGLDWSLVAPEVAGFAAAVAYDRAGLGWSEPGVRPRDIRTLVADLEAMLEQIGAPAPYVLVGHSYGGLIVRAYAYTYPDKVAGLVLVDPAHEDQLEYYPEAYAAKARSMGTMMARLRWLYRGAVGSGIPALRFESMSSPVADRLTPEVAAARRAVTVMDSTHPAASTDEMAALLPSLEQVRQMRRPLGDIPVRIISHGKPVGREAGVPEGLEGAVEEAWQAMQRDLLSISTDATQVVAEGSGHDIHVERPELVVEAIRDVLGR